MKSDINKDVINSIDSVVAKAFYVADCAHRRQLRNKFDENSTEPYINHPTKVAIEVAAIWVKDIIDVSFELIASAVMHDVLEDSDITADDLREYNFPENVIETVVALTRVPDEKYMDYIKRVSKNINAVLIKQRDIWDNVKTSPLSMIRKRYFPALDILEDEEKRYRNDKIS